MALEPVENGPGVARICSGCRRRSGGHQPNHRFAAVGDDHLFAGPSGFYQLREAVLGLQDVDLHEPLLRPSSWPEMAILARSVKACRRDPAPLPQLTLDAAHAEVFDFEEFLD